jgi:protein arginine kinase
MNRNIFLSLNDKWIDSEGPKSNVVISSRIRLARNLANLPFPHLMKDQDINNLFQLIEDNLDTFSFKIDFLRLKELTKLERQVLVEKHLISPEHAKKANGGLILNEDKSLSIMIFEEDHFRIQVILPGLNITEAFVFADKMDDLLENRLDFAFDENYGFLTSCPTNVGTGLRASVMVHLPGLVLTKQANKILSALSHVGVVVRGLYGEGTETLGNLFQISNQITIGRSEEEIINNLYTVVLKLINQEIGARELLLQEAKPVLLDRVHRAYGILTNARIITSEEALSLLSDLKLGIELNLLENLDPKLFNKLMVAIQPAYLQYSNNKEMSPMERDTYRAEQIQKLINK